MDVEKVLKECTALRRRVAELESAIKDANSLLTEIGSSPYGAHFRDPMVLGLGADGMPLFEYVSNKLRRTLKRWNR